MTTLTPPQPPTDVTLPTEKSANQITVAVAEKAKRSVKTAPKVDLQNLPDLLTISEVSGLLRVSPLTIKRWGKRGKLPAIRINSRGDRRYKKQAVLWMLGMTE
ncbi:MAG: MerR family transcriptional regulator [Candidatus Pacebacteria bacterium]|nr:MerR family transcriptional regulator [Candidatus Paceibacterota bacterium]